MQDIVIEQVSPASTWHLRHMVLWPEKPFDYVRIAEDDDGWHWAIYADHKQAGVISLFVDEKKARFRKFAVSPAYQNQGLGSRLLQHTFEEAKKLGATSIWCDARQEATSLYRRFGMEQDGEVFFKETIPYVKMKLDFEVRKAII
jgi:predicted GNAT family N-acyltransferase